MLMLGIYDKPNGTLLLDATPFISDDVVFSTNSHGDETLTCTVVRPLSDAFRLYNAGLLYVVLWYGVTPVWAGRWERPGLVAGAVTGTKLTARGGWASLSDEPYTALWSSTKVNTWRPLIATDRADAIADRFAFDTNNRLYITPQKNAIHGNTSPVKGGWLVTQAPDATMRGVATVSFHYDIPAGTTTWQYECRAFTTVWGGTTTVWSLAGGATAQSGDISVSAPNVSAVGFLMFYNAADAVYLGETGDRYLRITNLRITTSGAGIGADEVAKALVAYARIDNPTQLSSSTALIQSPGIDLTDELYEDQYPSAILTRLAGLHQWEVGVDRQRQLYFRPRGSAGQQWFVDLTALQLERAFDTLYNSAYGLYQDASSRKLRTAVASDAASVLASGITRRGIVAASTTSAATAGTFRDTSLSDTKNPLPAASFVFDKIYHANGTPVPLFFVQANDTITARNLPPALGSAIDRLRTFRISRTEYHVKPRTLRVEPESPLKNLDVLVARRSLA